MKVRLAGLAVAMMLVMAAIGTWRFAQLSEKNRADDLQSLIDSQTDSYRQTVEAQNKQVKEGLEKIFVEEVGLRTKESRFDFSLPLSKFLENSQFLGVGFLQLNSAGQYESKWFSAGSQVVPWSADFVKGLIPKLPLARVMDRHLIWARIESPSGQPLLAVMSSLQYRYENHKESGIVLGLLPIQEFAALANSFRGTGKELFLIDDKGFALTYPEQKYLGAKIDHHPWVKEILKSQEATATKITTNMVGQPAVAGFRRLNNSNLSVVMTYPLSASWMMGLSVEMFSFALGVAGLFGLAIWWFLKPFATGYEYLKQSILNLAEDAPLRQPVDCPAELNAIKLALDQIQSGGKNKAAKENESGETASEQSVAIFQQVSSGLAHSLKGPLAAILGHAQLARAKASDENLKQHFVVIERETRQARQVIDNLENLTDSKEVALRRVDVIEVLLGALSGLKESFTLQNVEVEKHLSSSVLVLADSAQLKTVFEEILRNAMEAMADNPASHRKIEIRDESQEGKVRLIIADHGKGLEAEELNKIFQPFYTTKASGEKVGLGLTKALGIIRNFSGRIYVDSQLGEGTRFTIELPLASKEAMAKLKVVSTSGETSQPEAKGISEDKVMGDISSTLSPVISQESQGEGPASSLGQTSSAGAETSSPVSSPFGEASVTEETGILAVDEKEDSFVVRDASSVSTSQESTETLSVVAAGESSSSTEERNENSQVAATKEKGFYDSPSASELLGLKPLTGSLAEQLPTAPGIDEITMIGWDINKAQEEWVSQQPQNESVPFSIRRPKVKVKS